MLINGREVNLEGRYWVFACKYYCPKGGLNDVYETDYGKVIRCPDSDTKRYVGGKIQTHNTVIVYDTNTKAEYDTVITITKKKKEP